MTTPLADSVSVAAEQSAAVTESALAKEEEAVEESSTDRLLFLSDGVFAIVITLLVLEIKVPHPHLEAAGEHAAFPTLYAALHNFLPLWPSLLGYVLSFLTVGIMWANHCVLFRYIKRNDHTQTILNTLLLMTICFVPFVTAVLADYLSLPAPYPQAAIVVYTASQVVMALLFNLLWRHASQGRRLLDLSLDPRLSDRVTQRYRLGPLWYGVAFALAFVHVYLSLGLIIALALIYALPYGQEARAVEERFTRRLRR